MRLLRAACALVTLVLLASCGSSNSSPSTVAVTVGATSTTSLPTTLPSPTTTVPAGSMLGKRYCEVLLMQPSGTGALATVYSTWTLNDCPEQRWKHLDAGAIATQNQVAIAFLNGPRYWTMDSVKKTPVAHRPKKSFGGIEMQQLATVSIASRADAVRPYAPSKVDRSAVFTFDAASTIYELAAPTGERYVMQSWSQEVDPTLKRSDLARLGSRLKLPKGWTYTSRVHADPLRVDTLHVPAEVLQDDLRNSYSLETKG